jgi:transcriptional regulator with XRE-family HTH domain
MTGGPADETETPREELSRRLRALFKAAGMSTIRADQLLRERGVASSQSKVSRTLNGRTAADADYVGHLYDLVGKEAAERAELIALAGVVKAGTRRLVLSRDEGALQERMGRYTRSATLVRTFTPAGLPGLAQTEAYIRRVMTEERGVQARLRNQQILDDEQRRYVWILTDGALGFPALLPPDGMAQQLEHFIQLSRRPNIRLGIIPWGRESDVIPIHGYDLFDDQVVVTGGETYGLDLDDPGDVAAYSSLTDRLEQLAVWNDDARRLVQAAADRYRDLRVVASSSP